MDYSGSKGKWDDYLGKYDVIRLSITDFMRESESVEQMLDYLSSEVIFELREAYPDVRFGNRINLRTVMERISKSNSRKFVIIIDEWDAVFREHQDNKQGQKLYLDFLREWLKDKGYVALAYMTGILPIKKYGNHSALNMFDEYSMTQPMRLAAYTGFTDDEVRMLCDRYEMDYEEISGWYNGYTVSDYIPVDRRKHCRETKSDGLLLRIYNPLSVIKAMLSGKIDNYWNVTETYEALQQYIDWDFDGLKEDVAVMMAGGHVSVDITGYQNDMTTFNSKDDILTMLVHLGYLGYNESSCKVFIPNREVLNVFRNSTQDRDWTVTFRSLHNSRELLEATWRLDQKAVAEFLEIAHDSAGNREYHSEAGLSYAVQLAYYAAQDLYTVVPELDTGKGYADLAYIPLKPNIPALLNELKYDQDAKTAITQIRRQRYPERLKLYRSNLILVGISYDRKISNDSISFKHHTCIIEKA